MKQLYQALAFSACSQASNLKLATDFTKDFPNPCRLVCKPVKDQGLYANVDIPDGKFVAFPTVSRLDDILVPKDGQVVATVDKFAVILRGQVAGVKLPTTTVYINKLVTKPADITKLISGQCEPSESPVLSLLGMLGHTPKSSDANVKLEKVNIDLGDVTVTIPYAVSMKPIKKDAQIAYYKR